MDIVKGRRVLIVNAGVFLSMYPPLMCLHKLAKANTVEVLRQFSHRLTLSLDFSKELRFSTSIIASIFLMNALSFRS